MENWADYEVVVYYQTTSSYGRLSAGPQRVAAPRPLRWVMDDSKSEEGGVKSTTKSLGLLGVVVVGAFGVVGCGSSESSSASTTSTTAAAEKVAPSYLFSFYGTDATVKRVAGSDMAYDVSVPVDAANTEVTWFTDRPNRDAGLITVGQFAAMWTEEGKDSFKANPPNVSIVFGSGQGKQKTAIAKMSNTKVVDNPTGNGQLLEARMTVDGNQAAALAKADGFVAVHAKRHTTPKTITNADTKHFAVFVDSYGRMPPCYQQEEDC